MGAPRQARWIELLGNQVIQLPRVKGRGSRWVVHFLAGVALLVTTALLASWVHVQTITTRYRYSQAYRVKQRRVQARDALEIERQMLRSPQRITCIAENEMGMVLPGVKDRMILE